MVPEGGRWPDRLFCALFTSSFSFTPSLFATFRKTHSEPADNNNNNNNERGVSRSPDVMLVAAFGLAGLRENEAACSPLCLLCRSTYSLPTSGWTGWTAVSLLSFSPISDGDEPSPIPPIGA
jgi:hypothetical protein